ncbi:MAG: ferric iron uptake transcriptional regulator [Pseudomonadota bacterium]
MPDRNELRKAGLKVTLPRVKILEILDSSETRHLSAEDIYRKLLELGEDIGLATVYRVLNQFEAAGLVVKHDFESDKSVFELDSGEHHDHMVDIDSGEVMEFFSEEMERLQHELCEERGYELADHTMVLYVRKKT